jgi:hypothetical protein
MAYLGLNTSGFQRGLATAVDGARKAGDTIGKEVSKDFTKSLKRTIGAGALVGGILAEFRSAERISNMAQAAGMTAQEFAALEIITDRFGDTSKFTAQELQEMTKALIDAGQVNSEDVFQTMAQSANLAESAVRALKVEFFSLIAATQNAYAQGVANVAALKSASLVARQARKAGKPESEVQKLAKQTFQEAIIAADNIDGAGMERFDPLSGFTPSERPDEESGLNEWRRWARSVENFNKKPRSEKTGSLLFGEDQFARIGLGAGRGVFDIQKQMLDEQKRTNRLLEKGLS